MSEQETYAEKIAKLLRKAESTSPEEAALLYAKAQELMTKYAIDEAMIAAAKGDKTSDPILHEEFVLTGGFRVALGNLTYQVLINNGLKAVLLQGGWREVGGKVVKQTYILEATGFKSDLNRARILDTSLQLQAATAMTAWWKENRDLYSDREGFLARRQFLFSFAAGAGEKLRTATARGKAAAEAEHSASSVALVLRDRSLMVQDEFTKRHPNLKNVKSRQTAGSAWAGAAGREAGRNADVGQPGVGGNRRSIGR